MNIIIYDNDIESHECLIAFIGNVGPELGKTDLQTCLFPLQTLHVFIFYSPSLQVKANLAWQAEFRRFDTRDDKHRNPAGWTTGPGCHYPGESMQKATPLGTCIDLCIQRILGCWMHAPILT